MYPFYMKYIGENTTFALNFDLKKNELVKFWKIDINDIYMGIVFILVRNKWGGHRWNIEEGLSQTLKLCQKRGNLI